ncbi:MAG: DNA polymerase III subunit epsilon [Alphaproteobacteria bacterium]|nr:DNA polymerase III subunit epsilon [Alphaproteobacteria bacterium]
MREIVLDTETTGLNPLGGDRVVEIGGVELINLMPTGRIYHGYFNPERAMPPEAARVHGLTEEFLADKPVFASSVDDFLTFIGETPLVIHNASFDMGFLNAELSRLGFPALPPSRAVDTLAMARRLFPGAPNSLDALCKRFGIDTSGREWHGALLDARLLADVYLELRGGRQPGLVMNVAGGRDEILPAAATGAFREPRAHAPTEEEKTAHAALVEALKNPLWKQSRRA